MKFTTNTKPLADALSLGVINSNVSNYHKKSNLAEVSATQYVLKINLEATSIKTQLVLTGSGDEASSPNIFVNCLQLKQLISTLDSSTVTIEFGEQGLTILSGKSKFTLPKVIDGDDISLDKPKNIPAGATLLDIDKTDWKFISSNQMYAIAMSFLYPVYTKVWVGEDGDVLVGDFNNSLFTHSKHSKLKNQCLLSDTIINLFVSLPDGAKLCKFNRDYLIYYKCDSFEYTTQFTPLYETDEGVGEYNAEVFLERMKHSPTNFTVKAADLNKVLNQAELLSTGGTEDTITFGKDGEEVYMKAKNVDCKIPAEGDVKSFKLDFKLNTLHSVLSSYGDVIIHIAPLYEDPDVEDSAVAGVLVWNDELTTCIAGVE